MKKMLRIIAVTFMAMLCLTGCGEEQDELLDYVNGDARKEVTDLEKKAKESYASVTGDNYQDDQTTLQELSANAVDPLKEAVDKATALGKKLEGEKLKKVHEMYVTALKDLQSGIDQFIEALESGDADGMTQVNETLTKANEGAAKYMEELKKLGEELDVEVKIE